MTAFHQGSLSALALSLLMVTPLCAHAVVIYERPQTFYDSLPSAEKGGELNLKLASDPKVMNPALSGDAESGAIEGYLWMTLMTIDPDTLKYLPSLATGYSVSDDKKSYTFTLNKEARWQDNTPVTADDIKFTFDTIMDTKVNAAALRSYYQGVKLEVNDTNTVTFSVEEPRFDHLFVFSLFTPIQKKQFEKSPDFNKDKGIMNPVSNGPYIFEKYERGQKVVLKRNRAWWGNSLKHYQNRFNMDAINFRIVGDPNLSYEKFIKGDLDTVSFTAEQWNTKVTGLDKEKFGDSAESGKNIWALKEENNFPKVYSYVGLNLRKPIFADAKTRNALAHLINYKKILEKVYYNLAIQSSSPFGSMTANSDPDLRTEEKMADFSKSKAKSLLKESGWKSDGKGQLVKEFNGKTIPFEFDLSIPSLSSTAPKIAQILKEDFKSFGIQINIKSLEWHSLLDKTQNHDFDAVILGWTSTLFPNPKQVWDSQSQENGGSNYVGYSNPKVDELIVKANQEFDISKRNLMMQELNRIIYEDKPYLFLIEQKFILEGLNSKIRSSKWVSKYSGGADSDLFYIPKMTSK